MRLDKYLKLSRLVKRRTLAQQMCEIGAVRVNGRVSKQSSNISDGDTVEIAYPRRILTVTVLCADEKQLKRKAVAFEIEDDVHVFDNERPW